MRIYNLRISFEHGTSIGAIILLQRGNLSSIILVYSKEGNMQMIWTSYFPSRDYKVYRENLRNTPEVFTDSQISPQVLSSLTF